MGAAAIRALRQTLRALPDGTLPVAAGLLVNGIAAYAFLVISARALGPAAYAPLSVLWTLVFLAGPGLFMPLEQELGRRIAAERGRTHGDLVRRAAAIGGALAIAVGAVGLAARGPILDRLLGGQPLLLAGLLVAVAGYYLAYLARGVLSGTGRFGHYGSLVGAEGVVRALACVALAVAGVRVAGPYGLLVGLAPIAATAVVWRRVRNDDTPSGSSAAWRELAAAMGHLLTSQALAQLLVNAGPLAVALLATRAQQDLAGRFLACLVLARVPLFLFQAVQAALLPKLSELVADDRAHDFRMALKRLSAVVAGVIAIGSAGAYLLGPEIVRAFFGPEFELGRRDLLFLAAGSGIYMLAIVFAQALIALGAHSRVAVGWLAGLVAFLVTTASGSDLLLRVETGLVVGGATAAVTMAAVALERMRITIPLRAAPEPLRG